MIRFSIVFIVNLLSSCCLAQHEDNIWMFGSSPYDEIQTELQLDTTWGATNIDFNYDPPRIRYDSLRFKDFAGTNSSITNEDGSILMYTNGQSIYDGNNEYIEDTINYNDQWENWIISSGDIHVRDGLPVIQGAIILPSPAGGEEYYVVYGQFDLESLDNYALSYTKIDLNIDLGNPIIEKDVVIKYNHFSSGSLNAVRHANGRDWWVFNLGELDNLIYVFLITPEGITEQSYSSGLSTMAGFGQLYISPDGTKIALQQMLELNVDDGAQIVIADFDRETGIVSNFIDELITSNNIAQGISFSPNSQFVYASNGLNMFQYDLESEDILDSKVLVAEYDGYRYYYGENDVVGFPTKFGWMGLAPDGKIYISTTSGGNRVMGRINNPNLKGVACDVDQNSVFLSTSYARTIPNFPNFRLGPLDDSPADTLGLNNHPVAKYRYVQDSLEDLRVHFFDLSYYDPQDYEWNFGDGNTSNELEPNHTYAEKGVYEVCLTVSNIYDTSTSCKTIMLGATSTIDRELAVDVSIYPNPTSDYLTINFHNYIAMDGMVRFYDVSGKEVMSAQLERASNVLDLGHLISGEYIYKVYDGKDEIFEGKVVVVR